MRHYWGMMSGCLCHMLSCDKAESDVLGHCWGRWPWSWEIEQPFSGASVFGAQGRLFLWVSISTIALCSYFPKCRKQGSPSSYLLEMQSVGAWS